MMSEFRDFELQQLGPSVADPRVLDRAVKKHKTGDAMAQMAITIVLMLAICAVTFVLSMDRAAAAVLQDSEGTVLSSSLAAIIALVALAGAALLAQARRTRPVPVPVRVRANRTPRPN